jgi:NAD(P)-dependent dehydrogenase (short-subunit alcohol dehydrogenase family)
MTTETAHGNSAPLGGRTAWITGAGRGIGAAVARALAAHGARVAVMARTPEAVGALAGEIDAGGGQALALVGDVGAPAAMMAARQLIRDRFGGLDIVVANAGIAIFRRIEETTFEEWERTIRTNLTGAFLTVQAALPLVPAEGGDILTMVSVAGRRPYPENGAYCASKFGLLGFTEVLRGELRGRKIRVTALLPGATDTPLWDGIAGRSFDRRRMMRPESVAAMAVSALAADRAANVEWIQMQPSGGSL